MNIERASGYDASIYTVNNRSTHPDERQYARDVTWLVATPSVAEVREGAFDQIRSALPDSARQLVLVGSLAIDDGCDPVAEWVRPSAVLGDIVINCVGEFPDIDGHKDSIIVCESYPLVATLEQETLTIRPEQLDACDGIRGPGGGDLIGLNGVHVWSQRDPEQSTSSLVIALAQSDGNHYMPVDGPGPVSLAAVHEFVLLSQQRSTLSDRRLSEPVPGAGSWLLRWLKMKIQKQPLR